MSPKTAPNLLWPLRRAARTAAVRDALVDGDRRWTYPELHDWVGRLSGALADCSEPGDRVAVLSANSAEYLASYFAIPAAGRVFVPLNPRLADAELRQVVGDCTPRVVLVDPPSRDRAGTLGVPVLTFDELRGAAHVDEPTGDDVAAIFYTGGTTGRAKGAVLTHSALAANAMHMVAGLGYSSEDVYLHASPMFHLGDGMSTYPVTWAGGRHVVIPRFDPALVVRAIETERVTCTFLVPTMLTLLMEHLDGLTSKPDLSSLRLIVHGGAPIAPAVLRRALRSFGCSFTQSYGMTEAGPILSFLPREEHRIGAEELKSAGQPVAGVEVRVVRPEGTDCAPGEVGEIIARGPNFALGYWNQPDVTASKFRDGWYWSGDLAFVDENSYLYIVGRAGDAIISGGENVYAAEVEAALSSHPDVVEAAVIAVPSPKWGEQVHAAVVLRTGAAIGQTELDAHCRLHIAGYKVPRSYEFHDLLPRTGPGKIDKQTLRAPHWAHQERDVS